VSFFKAAFFAARHFAARFFRGITDAVVSLDIDKTRIVYDDRGSYEAQDRRAYFSEEGRHAFAVTDLREYMSYDSRLFYVKDERSR
jgi:hypothetical protein